MRGRARPFAGSTVFINLHDLRYSCASNCEVKMQGGAGVVMQSETSPAADRLFTTAFILVISANLANSMGAQMASAILPVYVVSLGGSDFRAGLVTGMLAFTALLLRPFVGWLVDAWRRRPMVLIGTGCYTIANLMYAVFASLPLMLISRVIHGYGLSNYSTASGAFLADIAPPRRRAEAMGYYSVAMDIGLLGGPALAFFLVKYTGLQHIFFLTAALACVAFIISVPVREHRPPRIGPAAPWQIKTGIVSKSALPAAWMALCLGMGVGPITAFIAIFAQQKGVGNPGLYFTAQAVALMLSRTFSGRISDRRGRAFVIVPGLVCTAVGLLLLPFTHTLLQLMLSAVFIGIGFGSSQPATMAMSVDLVSPDERGMAVSTYFLGFDTGISTGSFAMGALATSFGFAVAWVAAAGCVLLGLLGVLATSRTHQRAN
jgi:MFS family permease